jgi:glycine cleavage system H protein
VVEINAALKEDPSQVNQDPYGKGWMVKLKSPGADLKGLMSAEEYATRHGE